MERTGSFAVHPPRVLFIDDRKTTCIGFGYAFRSAGLEPLVAFKFEAAWELAQGQVVDCAVVDWQFEGSRGDGIALIKDLKAAWPATPAILVSGYTKKYMQSRLQPTEIEEFFDKLDSKDIVQAAVDLVCQNRRTRAWLAFDALLLKLGAPSRKADDGLRELLARVCMDLSKKWSTEELCEVTGQASAKSLRTLFRRHLKTTPTPFFSGLRVEAAKQWLRETDLKHDTIARRVGLGTKQNLYRVFKRNGKPAPEAFRA